ncbi:hypothetical protein [Streptomyces sp. NBC_01477]|nr:hypothetical protein [Streptomyces sp. NBC_01477]
MNWIRQKATTDELCAAVTALKSSVHNKQFADYLEIVGILPACR